MHADLLERLREHQRAPAEHLFSLLGRFDSACDFSDTGTGKTYVSSAVACALNVPTLVIGPKIARATWERAAQHFGDSFSFVGYEMLRTGNTPFGRWEHHDAKPTIYFKCQCCQQKVDPAKETRCYCHPQGIHCLETKKISAKRGVFIFSPAVKLLIFDEAHRCGGLDSLNADMMIAAVQGQKKALFLTGTAATTPLNMRALGFALGFHGLDTSNLLRRQIPAFSTWVRRLGCKYVPRAGWKWMKPKEDQQRIMLTLRDQIIPSRGVRVTTNDIPGFPARDITAELYDVTSPEVIDGLYEKMRQSLDVLARKVEKDVENPLTTILRARQKIELLKVPAAIELGRDYRAKGMSVVWFVNFRQTIEALKAEFPDAPIIDGSPESARTRDFSVNEFQSQRVRELICNSDAGGITLSLQDLDGGFPRAGIVMPTWSAIILRQVFGRLHRDGGKSGCHYRVMFAAATIERQMHRALTRKLNNLDALNDADLQPENLNFA
jgi:hypothetical protein